MRRGAGIAAVQRRQLEQQQFTELGREVESVKIATVREILAEFSIQLANFASKHRDRINSDPVFRLQFHNMCKATGVDPLVTNKGLFSNILGIGNYYFDLGVVIVDICFRTRSQNGGIISMGGLLDAVRNSSESRKGVTVSDITRALEKLVVLGSGFRMVSLMGNVVVVSVPIELNKDHEEILLDAQTNGCVTESAMISTYGWTSERFRLAINPLLQEGLVWVDIHEGLTSYYFTSTLRSGYWQP